MRPPRPSPPPLNLPAARDVALTADVDFLGAWQDAFNTASDNADKVNDFFTAGSTALSQAISDNPDALTDNWDDVVTATTFSGDDLFPFPPDPDSLTIPVLSQTLNNLHLLTFLGMHGWPILPGVEFPEVPAEIMPLINSAASPLSGALIGALGPAIAPWVALSNSFTDISDALSGDTADWDTALQNLIDIPANMVNGFLNGATLDLDSLLPMLAGQLPEGIEIDHLSVALGGLFTPGQVGNYLDPGGSIFNSLGLALGGDMSVSFDGEAVGPIAALGEMAQVIADVLGGGA